MIAKDRSVRLIARLDVKGENLIKGVHLEGLRVVGDPQEYARRYYEQGVDELIYMDIVASLYGRSNLVEIVQRTAHDVFVPLTVGGGIRSIEDVSKLLRAGADKVAINTAAVHRSELIREVAQKFGSQCMVLSIEAKRHGNNQWEIYTDCGREKSGLDAIEWVKRGIELGAGEILLTSIDQEGTRKGFDLELLKAVSDVSPVPVIMSGGYGEPQHLKDVIASGADAVAFADALHYDRTELAELRNIAAEMNVKVRIA
ncbi:imidazole glycerol phosphate synthase subunit HisF [Vogesella indigofera]|uniref:imidazole glycerol phosphate synthase subunit HisF n=1 Tax=Vogesella indigofera TaxID=45465 RepID=UPI00234E6AA1|nr:imidazole glycerol phosphate synthase cyclase subunit [Vogesella indigofera]MDC7700858.1 imidazole glycerol phosphate synthase cyclase subunit [Vogesella indigofera]